LGGGRRASLNRVEVEISDEGAGYCGEVAGFVDGMRGSLELVPTETSKFETGISASGLSPDEAPELGPTEADASEVDASLSAGGVAFAVPRRHFAAMLANEPGVRLGEDPEDLHDMRVATRRLRATLKLYADFLPKRAGRYAREAAEIRASVPRSKPFRVLSKRWKNLRKTMKKRADEKVGG
jgi:inorganic triphosphatase YgiF